jgi:Lon protease-like protein
MTDLLERIKEIKVLPIFPLPLALFPNELLPLHIFEPRYRKMIADVERSNNLFGVVTLFEDDAFSGQPPIGRIGCAAETKEKEALEDGRSNIVTLGIVRFVLKEYIDSDEPYLIGSVECFTDDDGDSDEAKTIADEVFQKFERIASAAFKIAGDSSSPPKLTRTDPEPMSFLVAAAMSLDLEAKYEMLEMRSTFARLNRLDEMMARIVARIEGHANILSVSKRNGHGGRLPDA